jgi:hypothetical protein
VAQGQLDCTYHVSHRQKVLINLLIYWHLIAALFYMLLPVNEQSVFWPSTAETFTVHNPVSLPQVGLIRIYPDIPIDLVSFSLFSILSHCNQNTVSSAKQNELICSIIAAEPFCRLIEIFNYIWICKSGTVSLELQWVLVVSKPWTLFQKGSIMHII